MNAGAPRSSPYSERHSKRLIDFALAIIVVGAMLAIPVVVIHKRILPRGSPDAVDCK